MGTQDDVEAAVRDLSRIGIDSPDVSLGDGPHDHAPDAPVAAYPRTGWDGLLTQRTDADVVLDVRRRDEYADSHVEGAVNVPLHELLTHLDQVPHERLFVHCGSGYRAGVAASLLQRAGRDVVHVDATFGDAADSGVPMAETAGAHAGRD